MSRLIQFLAIVATAALAGALSIKPNICLNDKPTRTQDYSVECYKNIHNLSSEYSYMLNIDCKSDEPWESLLRENFDIKMLMRITFGECRFPADLSIRNITKTLGLGLIKELKLVKSSSVITREHLKDCPAESLQVSGTDLSNTQADLLWDCNVEEVILSNTNLRTIPRGFFSKSSNLKKLEILSNQLETLRPDDFEGLTNLTNLLVFQNYMEEILPGTFDSLTQLRVLDIGFNSIKFLPDGIFKNLQNLEKLSMHNNGLLELSPDLLKHSPRLQIVKLQNNQLTSLPAGFFANSANLKLVYLSENQLSSLPADAFAGAVSLNELCIDRNALTTLPEKIFHGTNLTTLTLSHNRLEKLPEGLFDGLSLRDLLMAGNNLTDLPRKIFAGQRQLKRLVLSDNGFARLDGEIFASLENVESINLSNNRLDTSRAGTSLLSLFARCFKLVDLNLSYNNISEISYNVGENRYLWKFNLEGNRINKFSIKDLSGLNHNASINLQRNEITTIDFSYLNEMANKPLLANCLQINFKDNPLNCDCRIVDFVNIVKGQLASEVYKCNFPLDWRALQCSGPVDKAGQTLNDIDPEELRCPVTSAEAGDACSECTCWEYSARQALAVDCSRRGFRDAPMGIRNERNLSIELNMTGNRLQETPKKRAYMLDVTVLDLSSNNITKVSADVFAAPRVSLQLYNNSISRLDPEAVAFLSNNTSLRKLTLHKNKWNCDCDSIDFLYAVQKKVATLGMHDVTCAGTNQLLANMTLSELCENTMTAMVVLCLLVAVFGLVIGGIVALYYRYQMEIKIWLYAKQCCLWFVVEDEVDTEKQYDAYISYSEKDEEVVHRELAAKLEEGPMPYKLCLPHRDWLGGDVLPVKIAESIEDSRRTIVVLSQNHLKSTWGRMEFQTAHNQALNEGRAPVIVILYGDMDNTEELDPELKVYLSTNTYVKWGDPWFWNKLRYALPHKHDLPAFKSRKARILKNHLFKPANGAYANPTQNEAIAMPKVPANDSNDSAKLLNTC